MKGEVGAQRGGWSFERRDWSLLKERLGLTGSCNKFGPKFHFCVVKNNMISRLQTGFGTKFLT